MMLYSFCGLLIAAHAVLTEAFSEGVGKGTVFTTNWVIGWVNILSTQVKLGSQYLQHVRK